jgi:adenylate cyclase
LATEHPERRLAAVLAADVAGYSRLMGADEEGTLARLKAARKSLIDPAIASHRGRIVKTTGDGMLVEFASAVDAVRSAIHVQRSMAEQNTPVPQHQRIEFRIGIHVGDIIHDDNDIFGDGVNIAARLEGIAEPGGVCMSDDAYRQVRGKVEIACDDLGPLNLKNIAEPMRAWRIEFGNRSAAKAQPISHAAQALALPLPDKPSIAVLPFQNMSGDPEQEYFADGLVEDIITALSRYRSLFVIARNSSFTYKGRAVDIRQVGRELGVRYVLEGSVRKAASRLRITGQLIEAATGAHLWAEKIDGSLEDVFELQDQVASSVAGVIDPVLLEAEVRRASVRPTSDLNSYDLFLRSAPLIRDWSREGTRQAIVFLKEAIERDPRYGLALGALAFCHSQNIWSGWSEDPNADIEECRSLARRTRAAAHGDPVAIGFAAGALMNLGDDTNVLKGEIDTGLAHNPNSALGWFWSGWMRTFSGENNLAIEHFERSLRLDPRTSRRAFHLTGMGICHFFERRFDKAASDLEASFHELPTYPTTKWLLAACYVRMGRLDEAREFAARNDIVAGGSWVHLKSRLNRHDPEQQEFLLASIRLATGGDT